MARIFGKLLGKGRTLAHARAAELRGELGQATALFAQAGRLDEAARVMVLRGDAEVDPSTRLRQYMQAVVTAPVDSGVRSHAMKRRAYTIIAMAADSPMTASLRQDLIHAASDLEAIGDHVRAAEAYARLGDVEGQARALARAGDVDALDALLVEEQLRDRETIGRRRAHDEMSVLVESGRRREAAAMARTSTDELLRERGRSIESRRITGSIVNARIRGKEMAVVLGDEVVIGRTRAQASSNDLSGSIAVASAAVSRRHVTVTRRDGRAIVRDLGGRNGTVLRGLALSGEATVGDGVELRLGRDVSLVVVPTNELPNAFAIEVAGMRYIAPLGPAMLAIGHWRLERRDDGWIELCTEDEPPAFVGALRLTTRVSLIAGDTLATERGAEPVLEVGNRVG
jgi:hypothetical protein